MPPADSTAFVISNRPARALIRAQTLRTCIGAALLVGRIGTVTPWPESAAHLLLQSTL